MVSIFKKYAKEFGLSQGKNGYLLEFLKSLLLKDNSDSVMKSILQNVN